MWCYPNKYDFGCMLVNKCIYAGGLVRERGRETEGEGQRKREREGGERKRLYFLAKRRGWCVFASVVDVDKCQRATQTQSQKKMKNIFVAFDLHRVNFFSSPDQ